MAEICSRVADAISFEARQHELLSCWVRILRVVVVVVVVVVVFLFSLMLMSMLLLVSAV